MSKKTYCDICGEEIATVVINHSNSLPVVFKQGPNTVAKGGLFVLKNDDEFGDEEQPDFCMECAVQSVAKLSTAPKHMPFQLTAPWLEEQFNLAGFRSAKQLTPTEISERIALIVDRFNRLQ